MLSLDGLLRGSDAFSDQTRLDGHILFHAQAQHEILHALTAENSEEVILQREIETRTSGVALTSGTTAQLIIDTPGFVTLRSEDVQTTEIDDFPMLGLHLALNLSLDLFEL